jgi:hypothetical protein
MRFINDDVELVHDKRLIPYSNDSTNWMWQLISRKAEEYGYHGPKAYEVKGIMKNDPIVKADNIFGVGIENFLSCDDYRCGDFDLGQHLLGMQHFNNGITFYGFIAGGDGQRSVFMILYQDGENLRLYTPLWGNKLNLNRHEPLMNDERSEKYMKKYGLDKKTLGFNWNAIKVDILANIQVDYESVREKHLAYVERVGK